MTEQTTPNDGAATPDETAAPVAPAAAPAPRRRFTVQRGGCGCEGKPSPTAQSKPTQDSR
ncbi:hypothetical protein OG765_37175 [Streptomyces sp. NBC_00555]|uniref:hypothetical protein n=1 Tax=Streptomyces sp. NBC_00555 TaxID=2903662 RepID=UPI00224CFF9C|nr:hypothetical protein [Streptomyces sp. NBC_00555]MCX5016558.1 hypothetical protein [Streptomyces sp. NBC_00555]